MSAVVGRGLAAHMEAVGGSVCPDCGAVESVERPGGQEGVGACGCPGGQGQLKVEANLPR